MIPGVVLIPIPIPVNKPKVMNKVSTLEAKMVNVIPIKHNKEPINVTLRQLYLWHRALVKGAMARAKVVILAGIHDANATEEFGNVSKIKSKITP